MWVIIRFIIDMTVRNKRMDSLHFILIFRLLVTIRYLNLSMKAKDVHVQVTHLKEPPNRVSDQLFPRIEHVTEYFDHLQKLRTMLAC